MNINRLNQLAGLTIARPTSTTKMVTRWIPAGPKTKPKTDKGPSRYLPEFIEIIADMIYTDQQTLKEIAVILNMADLKTTRGNEWHAGYVDSAIRTEQGWAIIEPLWNNWCALNPSYVPNTGRPKTVHKQTHTKTAADHVNCAFCEMGAIA